MAWLSKVAQSFSGTQSICCSPASVRQNIQIPCIKFHQLLVCLQKTLMTQFIQTIREYTFQTFTSFHLAQYKCPERYFHKKKYIIDSLQFTGLRHFDSPSNPCATNWFSGLALCLSIERAREAKPREARATAFSHVLVNFHLKYLNNLPRHVRGHFHLTHVSLLACYTRRTKKRKERLFVVYIANRK